MVTVMVYSQAQAIQTGIDGAANQVKGIFSNVSNLILMLGGIIGLAGGIRVYQKWNNGDHDINKELIGWGGSAVFLLLAGTTLKLFFGI
jgi:predicted transporter